MNQGVPNSLIIQLSVDDKAPLKRKIESMNKRFVIKELKNLFSLAKYFVCRSKQMGSRRSLAVVSHSFYFCLIQTLKVLKISTGVNYGFV